jgi:dienelactone hydrolase
MGFRGTLMNEEPILFGSAHTLVGVVTASPEGGQPAGLPAVLLLNAGRTHHAGPNRLYVKIARSLAAQGFIALRFDFSGVGDSRARKGVLPLQTSMLQEVREAMDQLHASRGIRQFVLMGICSGASVAWRAACQDPRVVGALIVNGYAHLYEEHRDMNSAFSGSVLVRHFLRVGFSSSFRAQTWRRLLTGKVDYRSLIRTLASLPILVFSGRRSGDAAVIERLAADSRALEARGVRIFHLYSEGDEGLDHYRLAARRLIARAGGVMWSRMEVLTGANHTFITLWSQQKLVEMICEWVKTFR